MRARCNSSPLRLVLLCLCGTIAGAAVALAEPVPKVTPFEGLWVPKGQTATCADAKNGAGGDVLLIEGRSIGAGDTVCTMLDMVVRGQTYFIRMDCHGLNRSFIGTKFIRIDLLSKARMLFRHQNEAASEMELCR